MKRWMIVISLLAATPLLAAELDDCSAANQLAALYQLRSVILRSGNSSDDVNKFIDSKVDQLRVPLSSGGFRWVRWVRPPGNPPYDKHGHNVVAVQGSGSDHFEASGDHPFAIRVAVPSKRSLFNGNHPVYVGTVRLTYSVNGRTRSKDEPINDWMNPDTTRTIDLGAIADHVDVSLEAATNQRDVRESLVEIHVLKAVAEDDPANPNYDTIVTLRRLRDATDPDAVDDEIGRLEPDSLPLVHIVHALRRADDLLRSNKQEEQEKGERLLKETLRRLR